MTVANDDVSIVENLQRCHPSQGDVGQILLLQPPDDFFLRRHFDNTVPIAGGNQRIAIAKSDRRKE